MLLILWILQWWLRSEAALGERWSHKTRWRAAMRRSSAFFVFTGIKIYFMNKRHVTALWIFGSCSVARPILWVRNNCWFEQRDIHNKVLWWLLFVILSWLLFHHDVNAIIVMRCVLLLYYLVYVLHKWNFQYDWIFTKSLELWTHDKVWDIFPSWYKIFNCWISLIAKSCAYDALELLLSKEQKESSLST